MTPGRARLALAAAAMLVGTPLLGACSPADPESPEIRARAAAAGTAADRMLEQLRDGGPLAAAFRDGCRRGQHNWKVKDDFDWDCGFHRYQAVEANGTLREVIEAQHQRLLAAGCQPDQTDNEQRRGLPVMLDHYEKYASSPHKLPSVRYLCAHQVAVGVKISDPSDPSLSSGPVLDAWSQGALAQDRVLSEEVPDEATRARLTGSKARVLVLQTASVKYYRS
ncbi:hypothetical protein HJ590_12855 [Naumannella sp. ID2617S]|nr:hypothetical protein [Naumannella sp. ID2617S]